MFFPRETSLARSSALPSIIRGEDDEGDDDDDDDDDDGSSSKASRRADLRSTSPLSHTRCFRIRISAGRCALNDALAFVYRCTMTSLASSRV